MPEHERDDPSPGGVYAPASIVSDADEAIFQIFGGRFTHVNRAAERMFGYSALELLGRTPMMLVPAERVVEVADIHARVLRGETARVTTQRQRADGTLLDVSITVTPVFDDAGKVIGETATDRDITAQLATERRLLAAEANLRAIMEHVPCGLSLRGLDGRYMHVNSIVAQALESTPAELVGRDPSEHLDPQARAVMRAQDKEMRRTGLPVTQETRIPSSDGTVHDYLAIKYPVFDELGAVSGYGTFSLDITDRKRAENELRAAEQRLRRLVEAAPDALVIADSDGTILELNAIAEELFGWSSEELLGRPLELLVAADRRDTHLARRRDFFANPRRRRVETRARRRDGDEFPVEVTMNAMRDQDGVVVEVISLRDITDRLRARTEREHARERFRLAFEGSPLGMVLFDLRGHFEQVNDAFCRIVGYSREQLIGMSFEAITHPDDITASVEVLLGMLGDERSVGVTEKRYIHAAGHEVTVRVHATLLRAADGTPLNFLDHFEDISGRARERQRLAHLADHDALSGLLHLGAFERVLTAYGHNVERYGLSGAVLVISVNGSLEEHADEDAGEGHADQDADGHADQDAGGHADQDAGEELLLQAAGALAGRTRGSDVLARLGASEFGVLLPRADASGAVQIAEQLHSALHEAPMITADAPQITASIGVALFHGGGDHSSDEVLADARCAMRDAKAAGGDRIVVCADGKRQATRTSARATGSRIRSAIAQGRVMLLAQPIVELASGRTAFYELLSRIRDEHGDQIPPAAFLYAAERRGLSAALDRHVTSSAIATLARRDRESFPAAAVNLSRAAITDQSFLEHVTLELQAHGVDPARLIFEIPQDAVLESVTDAIAFGRALSRIGCGYALDKFTPDYGSSVYLKHLQLGLIKIDGELVRSAAENDHTQLLIASLLALADQHGQKVVAKSIQDATTLHDMLALGVTYGQGYHLGAPTPLVLGDHPDRIEDKDAACR